MAKIIPSTAAPSTPPQAPKSAKSAKPGTEDTAGKKEKKPKVVRVLHPALKPNAEGKATERLKEIPADFDKKVHKPLKRKDFATEALWYELKARECDARAAQFRQLANESEKLGSVADRAKAKRYLQLQKRIEEVKKTLLAEGVDIAALEASLAAAAKS